MRLAPTILLILASHAASFAQTTATVGRSEPGQAPAIPPWKRQLAGEEASRVEKMEKEVDQLRREGRFAEAIGPAREAAAIRSRVQGADHWQTADARRAAGDLERIKDLPAEGRRALASLGDLAEKADLDYDSGRYAEAERRDRAILEIRRRWLGDDHPDTAQSELGVANSLYARGRYDEAESWDRKALAIRREALGEDHPLTAESYNNLAFKLSERGRYGEAEKLHRLALVLWQNAMGDDSADAAVGQNNLALDLQRQSRYSEAEPLYRRALAIWLRTWDEEHRAIATGFSNIAFVLGAQGRYAEAEPLYRKALALDLRARGDRHPATAVGFSNLAWNLGAQGKYAEADSLYRKALSVRLERLGENHPETGRLYNNLAHILKSEGKGAEAEVLQQKALAVWTQALGKDHPLTASSLSNVASNLDDRGRHREAEPLCRESLRIFLETVGPSHPDTALAHGRLANNLESQGKCDDAVTSWTAAAQAYEQSRGARGASGWERSLTSTSSPLPALAVALARRGQPRDAWTRWETDLARGLLDDLSVRQLRPTPPEERRREAELAGQLQRLDEQIARLAARGRRTEADDRLIDELRDQQSAHRGRWVDLQNALDRRYQAYAGKPSTLGEVQQALRGDAALLGWLDVKSEHWACLLRHEGDPIWFKIAGTGRDGAWTEDDEERPGKLRMALAGHRIGCDALARELARQRLAAILPHLKGIKHLIVLPSHAMAGVPIEPLVADGHSGDAPSFVISYAPSGSMYARLTAHRPRPPEPPRLLALGDPAYPRPAIAGPLPTPPDHGLAILDVVPNGTADLFGIRPGDVLLVYDGTVLKSPSDLPIDRAGERPIKVPVTIWRDGEVRMLELPAGPLGIQSDPKRTAAQVVLARRAVSELLDPRVRAEGLSSLPGSRREVETIAALLPDDRVTMLLGTKATESNLQAMARSGELKRYRIIHIATHGKPNRDIAMSSALFLASEPDRSAATTDPAETESAPDGRVTAEQIVRTWDLDADLVVLSACESGLGRYAGGEGYLGFAQALFVKGARSLVLSQWKVDDKATALLMARFYRNLLGKRPGLPGPMPRAEALHEAKRWLRRLTADEVGSELAALDRGPERPVAQESGGPAHGAAPSDKPAGSRPYEHPYYWAAFILIGNPE